MNFELIQIGRKTSGVSTIMELTVTAGGAAITEDVTNLNGVVDESLIENLRAIADELEEQNEKISRRTFSPLKEGEVLPDGIYTVITNIGRRITVEMSKGKWCRHISEICEGESVISYKENTIN